MSREAGRRDVLQILIHDHREVEDMVATFETGGIGDARNLQDLVEQITIELVRHFVSEERHLYPVVRRHVPGGEALADQAVADHAEVERLLNDLEGRKPADPLFAEAFRRLAAAVRAHVEDTENGLFPRLAAECTAEQLLELGDKVAAAKRVAPTRPHPRTPDALLTNSVTSPLLGLIDRTRDMLTRRAADDA